MTYKEAVKMQWRRDAADQICDRAGWKSEECQNTQSLVVMQNDSVERSMRVQDAMFPLSLYAVAFLFGVVCWKAMINYMKYGPDGGKTAVIYFLWYLGPAPFLLMMAISAWRMYQIFPWV